MTHDTINITVAHLRARRGGVVCTADPVVPGTLPHEVTTDGGAWQMRTEEDGLVTSELVVIPVKQVRGGGGGGGGVGPPPPPF